MKKFGKRILEIRIDLDVEKIRRFESTSGTVAMLPFGGEVLSGVMTGIVEPFGVDTQITNPAGVRHMSARYMLSGQDEEGKECHIYVENNAWFGDGESPAPFYTVPTFLTDSAKLSEYFGSHHFIGEGAHKNGSLIISFYEAE